jgi:hypothetical protein
MTSAKFNPDDRFAWLNGTLQLARRGLSDRYGLDADYVTRDRRRALEEPKVMM